ncbi:DENN domain-containing protein 1A isoform X3 [Bicyclus anynana]|uniref:DENN domain-containing protein 1A isoform X3 n=1 Tax=Bicyclus anynana TaxID=110368 RepID=A0A6J1NCG6_BICAN|nr:DENN domain-containing protein 1A isoform X3 [Bicyclus anynana]
MGSRVRDTVRYLFELFCEVSPGDHVRDPYIVRKYPDVYKNEEELKNIPKFTFPCQFDNTFVQHYSFVLTSVDSKYTFCFCRYDPKANTSLVLLSHLPWHDIFYKLLNCIANLLNSAERGELTSFLEACRSRPPLPGHTLKVTYNAGHNAFSCQSPDNKLPSIPENCNLTEYFSAMDTKCMCGLWAALLHERRVAIVASKPSRLSAVVQAANATLFPMSWQHIFIPILPKHLVDYLLAPMPFLIGVPRCVMETVRMSEVGDVVVLDVDANELKSPFHDLESLPQDMVTGLKKALSDKNALGDAVSRAFLRALVCLIGGYRDAIRIEKGQLITFNPEAFVRTRKHMQPFLRKILQSQIFQQFIDERLELLNSGRGFNDEFEVECNNYAEKVSTGSGQRLKQQYRDWAKTVKKEGGAFFKTVKDKVRQGGKNVKSAVRGLKNKMPKTGSRPSSINTTDDSRKICSRCSARGVTPSNPNTDPIFGPSRLSCGSATPVSSDSSDSTPSRDAPPREPPPALPLDLLTEMEFLLNNKRRDSLPAEARDADVSLADRAKTLSPFPPPRLPARPVPPARYPIVSTRRLVDVSDAPAPPPRAHPAPAATTFVTDLTRTDGVAADFHTSTIRFTEGGDKAKLELTLSSNRRSDPPNGTAIKPSRAPLAPLPAPDRPRPRPLCKSRTRESCDSDLIKLDDSPNLEDFDPLKYRDKNDKSGPAKTSTDSALLHEYGLDFSQFGLSEFSAGSSAQPEPSGVPKGWTTFN